MRLYFIRHGQSEANVERVISNRGWKHPLTDLGRAQAQALADRLRGEGITHLFSSPVMRAVQTAEMIGSVLELPFTIEEALRENDNGSLDGRSDDEAWAIYNRAMQLWYLGVEDARIADGESLKELRGRFAGFIQSLEEGHGRKSSRIVLVGHGGLFRAGLPALVDRIDPSFAWAHPLGNCGMVVAETRRGGKLRCIHWDGAELGWRKG